MSFRFKIILFIFLLSLFLFPAISNAAGVGFVPSSRLWFSSLVFPPKESTNIYTVIINNNYFSLDAIVGFYVDEKLIDTTYISSLKKEQAVQAKGNWWPTEGQHSISVKFVKATAIDANGNKTELNVQEFNTVDSTAVQIGDSLPVNNSANGMSSTVLSVLNNNTNIGLANTPMINLNIEKNGNNLAVVAVGPAVATSESEQLQQTMEQKIQTAIQQGQDIRNKIVSVFNTASSGIHSASDAYTKTKSMINDASQYVDKNKITQAWPELLTNKIKIWWASFWSVSDFRNNLAWVFRIVFFLVLFYLLIKMVRVFFHRRRYDEDD